MSTTDEVDSVRRVTENPAAVLLLAVIDGTIVGTLLGTFDGWRGNLYRLVVAPEHRRQGIGRQLVRQVEQIFRHWGVRRTRMVTSIVQGNRFGRRGYPRDQGIVRQVGGHAWPIWRARREQEAGPSTMLVRRGRASR